MVIRKKSRKELMNQTESFLNHSENIWKITNSKKRDIFHILNDDDLMQKIDKYIAKPQK